MTTKAELLKIIRDNCIDCSGGNVREVNLCTDTMCRMHPLRFGKDPNPSSTRGFAKSPCRRSVLSDKSTSNKNPGTAGTATGEKPNPLEPVKKGKLDDEDCE